MAKKRARTKTALTPVALPETAETSIAKARPYHNRKLFLENFRKCGNITQAARETGVAPNTHYQKWMKDRLYRKEFGEAKEEAIQNLEAEARRRAMGFEEVVMTKAGPVAMTKYSDTLLIFLLKGMRPEKYKDRWFEPNKGMTVSDSTINVLVAGDSEKEYVRKLLQAEKVAAKKEKK